MELPNKVEYKQNKKRPISILTDWFDQVEGEFVFNTSIFIQLWYERFTKHLQIEDVLRRCWRQQTRELSINIVTVEIDVFGEVFFTQLVIGSEKFGF